MPRKNSSDSASVRKLIAEKSQPVTESGCWIWMWSVNPSGYGKLKFSGKIVGAHRASYVAFNGAIPDGSCVCHKCDVPACVNPAHLFVASHLENMRDRDKKGRLVRLTGSMNGSCRLSGSQVAEIRRIYASGKASQVAIAKKFGVHHTTVSHIVRRKTWPHI